jgi:site-specific DNA recombinase
MKAIGIIRVSRVKGRDGESFASPKEQRERIESACEREGLKLLRVESELDVSGGKPLEQRPGLKAAIESIESGEANVIVAAYFDRLYRSQRTMIECTQRVQTAKGRVLTVDAGYVGEETSGEWLDLTMRGMMAEYYRRQTGERTHEAKRRAVERGVPVFPNIPPGYFKGEDGKLLVHPTEGPVVTKAFKMRADGSSIKDVRTYLQANGVERTYHGVQALMRSKIVLGRIEFGELVNESAHEPVVDEDTWRRVQRRKDSRGRRAKSDRLLARQGILRCSSCGAPMVVGSAEKGTYPTYRCSPTGDCKRRVTISAKIVEQVVSEQVRSALSELRGRASDDTYVQDAEKELATAQDALDAAVEAFDGVDAGSVNKRLRELTEARNAAQEALDQIGGTQARAEQIDTLSDWDRLTLDERRALIRATVESVTVVPAAKGLRGGSRVAIALFSEQTATSAV